MPAASQQRGMNNISFGTCTSPARPHATAWLGGRNKHNLCCAALSPKIRKILEIWIHCDFQRKTCQALVFFEQREKCIGLFPEIRKYH